jgi:hypothetical protein
VLHIAHRDRLFVEFNVAPESSRGTVCAAEPSLHPPIGTEPGGGWHCSTPIGTSLGQAYSQSMDGIDLFAEPLAKGAD